MIRVGIVSRTATYWPLYLLARDGAARLVELGSTAAGVDALLDGRVDLAVTCPDVLIAHDAPLRVLAGLVDRPPAWLVAAPHVTSVADLRGRRIATTAAQGSVSVFLRALLRARGLERGDYEEVVVGPTPAQAAALERGDVDAAMVTAPFDEDLATRGFRRLAHVGDALGPCAFTTVNVREGWTASAAHAWLPFHDRLRAAIERVRKPRESELEALARGTGVATRAAPRIAFDQRVSVLGLDTLLGYLRREGVTTASAADARTWIRSPYAATSSASEGGA